MHVCGSFVSQCLGIDKGRRLVVARRSPLRQQLVIQPACASWKLFAKLTCRFSKQRPRAAEANPVFEELLLHVLLHRLPDRRMPRGGVLSLPSSMAWCVVCGILNPKPNALHPTPFKPQSLAPETYHPSRVSLLLTIHGGRPRWLGAGLVSQESFARVHAQVCTQTWVGTALAFETSEATRAGWRDLFDSRAILPITQNNHPDIWRFATFSSQIVALPRLTICE